MTHPSSNCKLNSEGTHVIVGGTGGLGRSMVRWMVNRGAKHFLLVSRSGGHGEKLQQLLDEVQGKAQVHIRKCDIADSKQVQLLVDNCPKTLPPICGVINAVMALHVSSPIPYDSPATWKQVSNDQPRNRTISLRT